MLRFEPSVSALVRGGSYGNRAFPSSRGRAGRALIVMLGALVLASCGSGRGRDGGPHASLASSPAAQREFRALHEGWVGKTASERARLRPSLDRFLARHGADPRARLARLYLAWILIDQGEIAAARGLVEQTRTGPAGSAHDFAEVARARILVREGKPELALALLEPLEGKIVDSDERVLYGEERLLASLAAGRHTDAVRFALLWLSEAPAEDREAIGKRISALLKTMPAPALEHGLRELDAEAARGSAPGRAAVRDWLRKALREHLVELALARRDGELARRLLDSGPASLRRGERGNELSRLASAGTVVPRVAGRAIGFVLGMGGSAARRASADAAAGISRALGLPERDADPAAVRLITAEDGGEEGGVQAALASLAGDGAAILIAGVDARSAEEAKAYADRAAIPVIVLSRQQVLDARGFTFDIGADAALDDAALGEELTRRKLSSPARVGPSGVPCSVTAAGAGLPRFPVQVWKRDRIDALLLLGDATCAREAVSELAAAGVRPVLGFGLECAELLTALPTSHARFAVGAGAFPMRDDAPDGMKRWRERTGRPPTWASALGHDAAVLASAAIADFALTRVDDARAVSELHRRAQRNLARVKAALWTSERSGFEGGRRLARTLSIVSRQRSDEP